ncbi:hypothetical protein [Rhizobium rhizogenes]|nr:hypothetical protein [Rhizobium rhizogenes]MCZ7448247.1 hypothetical protein [Rhizobium rhizogenes]MCZ7465908.1 hypothetical protein [Rhizobium rhizogenes]
MVRARSFKWFEVEGDCRSSFYVALAKRRRGDFAFHSMEVPEGVVILQMKRDISDLDSGS